jgi:hypothetical protein
VTQAARWARVFWDGGRKRGGTFRLRIGVFL